jgi:hypothetical protein
MPDIVGRAGLDINPVDLGREDDTAWLETLVWPGQEERVARLRQAMAIARHASISLVQGNVLADLSELAAQAPRDVTLVVFHTAMQAYLEPAERGMQGGLADTPEHRPERCDRKAYLWIENGSCTWLSYARFRSGSCRLPGSVMKDSECSHGSRRG